ncbi:MAG: dehydratase [Candidatus Bathyarchaeota archaeon B23]|nr:MAG: dehydratase [Candidatus Bathyarchaeota archaeon B23]
MARALKMEEADNVATLLSEVSQGEVVEIVSEEGYVVDRVEALDAVPFGHKIALVDVERGERIIKYGEAIGVASRGIRRGEWAHTHNVDSLRLPERG